MNTCKALAEAARDAERRSMITHELHVAIARYYAAQAVCGWQPIETAPKDGTLADLWCVSKNISVGPERVTDCWYSYDGWWRSDERGDRYGRSGVFNATHWRPLPDAPVKKSATSEAGG